MKHRSVSWIVLGAGLLSAACGGGDPKPADPEDPAEHACEHTAEPGTPLEPAVARDGSAPLLELAGEPYIVTLSSSEPRFLRLEGLSDGLLFAAPADIVSGLYFGDGADDELPEASPNEFCASEIPEHYDLALERSGTYYLELAPSAVPSVWLLYTEAEGHGH